WNPNPNIYVYSILPHGKEIYLGGVFSQMNGQDQHYLAKVNNKNGRLIRWNPAPNNYVNRFYASGNHVYVGGLFTAIRTKNRNSLAAFDASSGALLPFYAKSQYNNSSWENSVKALSVYGDQLFVGTGNVALVKGQKFGNLFSIDTTG